MCKHGPSVEGGELLANVCKGVGGGDAMHKELCIGRVETVVELGIRWRNCKILLLSEVPV